VSPQPDKKGGRIERYRRRNFRKSRGEWANKRGVETPCAPTTYPFQKVPGESRKNKCGKRKGFRGGKQRGGGTEERPGGLVRA